MSGEKNKKILFIVQLPPPIHGASIMNSYLVKSEVVKSSFDMQLINLQFVKSLTEIRKFSIKKLFKSVYYFYEILWKMMIHRPDLVYFTISPAGYAFYRDALYCFLIKLFKRKIVFHLHGKGITKNVRGNSLKKFVYRRVFRRTNIICLSESLSSDLESVYEPTPYIVPNGIRLQKGITDIIPRTNDIVQLLFLSNFKYSKGLMVLIEALEIIKHQGFTFKARLAGADADLTSEYLKDVIIKKDLQDTIEVVGPRYGDDKTMEFQRADIFVFPTFYNNEAFPLVILEAMQYGLPVISTMEGGIPDMVINNKTGFIVERENSKMLAEKIIILLNDKNLRCSMGKTGYERFINNYTLNHFEDNMKNTFQNILETNIY